MKFFKKIAAPFQVFNPDKPALIAFALGAASVAAFAPLYLSPLMVGTLAWLFWLWHNAESRLSFIRIGLWFGLGFFGFGVSWLFSSMYFYSGMSIIASAMATFVWVLFLSLYVAFAGWLISFFHQKQQPGIGLVVLMPAAFMLAEFLRAKLFTGFPFLIVGNTHLFTWLDGYAPVFGTYFMTWVVALSAGLLVWLAHYRNWMVGAGVFAAVWLSGAALKSIEWVKPVAEPIDIALLQGNISQDKKWLKSEFLPTMKTYISQTKENIDADVIVWPETAIPGYMDTVREGALYSFIKDAELLEKDILLGVIDRNRDTGEYFNALVNAKNSMQEVYYKYHLVPFSEYFPFSDMFKALSLIFEIPFSEFAAGTTQPKPMMLGGQPAGLSVCYEMAFGDELAYNVPHNRYLITVSNDAWFAKTLEPSQQVHDVQMRALELGREIARSTNTGYTIIVGTNGRIKQEIPAYEAGVLRGDVQPYEGVTPFVKWKYWPLVVLIAAVFAFLMVNKRRQKAITSHEQS